MTSTKLKIRSLFLTALMVTSIFAGTLAFSGAVAAGNAANADSSITPSTVDEESTNTHQVVLAAGNVNTGNNQKQSFRVNLPNSKINLSSSQVTNFQVIEGAVSYQGSNNIDSTSNVIRIDLEDDGGSADDDVRVSFDLTNVAIGSVSSETTATAEIGFDENSDGDLGDSNDDAYEPFQTLTIRDLDASQRGNASSYSVRDSSGDIGPGAIVYQGEDDITFVDKNGDPIPGQPSSIERTGGANEGEPLEVPIPRDQPTGSYESPTGTPYTVSTPRISSLDVTNQNGADVSGGSVNVDSATELTVDAEYNFQNAERLEVVVEDSDGLDVTDEVVEGASIVSSANGEISVDLNEQQLDNEEYTVNVAGEDDLDYVTREVSFDVTSGEDASITVDSDQVTRGEDVGFTIGQSAEGALHLVRIDSDSIDGTANSVFRNVGDTVTTGSEDGDAFALVEIDGGEGVGSIDTDQLDTTDVEVEVFSANDSPDSESEFNTLGDNNGFPVPTNPADDVEFEVVEGEITLDNPQGSYVVGSEATINGTASTGIDDVALYVRDEGDYELLTTVSVDGDDEFEKEDVVLSDDGGDVQTDVLSLPGTYRLAVVDAGDSNLGRTEGGDLAQTQTASQISTSTGLQTTLRVVDTELTVDYVSIINGQVAVPDTQAPGLTINGTAPGQDEVSVSFYGPRGTYDTTSISVDSDDVFESESVAVGSNLDNSQAYEGPDTDLSQGNVVMTVYSLGRDGVPGDGELSGSYEGGNLNERFISFYEALNSGSNSQEQLINKVASETTEDTGSDDISRAFRFRLTSAQTSINTVTSETGGANTVVAGEDAMISGVTNRQPEDNTITVEIIDGPTTSEFEIESTEDWGTSGQWNVTLSARNPTPGNYTVEADDGQNTDIYSFQVVNESVDPGPTATVTFNDQQTTGSYAVVESADLPDGGFVTIHDSTVSNDAFGSVRGTSAYLDAGTSTDINITLDQPAEESGQFFAMPHRDTDGDETYDFVSSNGDDDGPYLNADGQIVLDGAQIQVGPMDTATPTPTPTEADEPTPTPTEADEPTPTDEETTTTSSDGQPGFGLAVSLIALVGAALIALRRRD
jgi:major cell surface glycoprotein (TIGR04216 family)